MFTDTAFAVTNCTIYTICNVTCPGSGGGEWVMPEEPIVIDDPNCE